MANWQHRVKIKHLFTENEDHASVQASMNAVADVLASDNWFNTFRGINKFRNIPKGNEDFGPCDYANRYLSDLYDFSDDNLIWIE